MERRAAYQAAIVFGVALAAGAAVAVHLDRLDAEAHRRTAADLAHGSAFAIEQELSRSLASASTLAALVEAGASDAELTAVATRLLQVNGGTANLQLARDGVISHLWPLRGNEPAVGLDLLRHPLHGEYVRRTIASRRSLLYGPFELVQGGAGLALRVPVFVREGTGERFWGLASAIIRVQVLLEQSRAPRLVEAGFDWELGRAAPGGGGAERLASSRGGGGLRDPVSVAVHLPGQAWALAVAPRAGWRTRPFPWALHAVVLLVALLAAVLAYRILGLPEILRREVAARTGELEIAHREQRRAEEAQRHSQKLEAIGLLAGGVAHDFNNLLVGILGYADLLAEGAAPGSVQEEAARTISQAARRAAELTRQLLAFARLGQHREEQVDAHALVREVTALLGRTLEKSIRLEMRLEAPLHHVRGDTAQLQQVILNLAVNARDAMPEGGTLTVETTVEDLDETSAPPGLRPGRHLVLSVSDTGLGIPMEHLERIFEPFFTTKAEGRGSGLGLATVYGIVKAHGGAVRVQSEEGHGSRFVVHLPVQAEPVAPAVQPAARAPRGTGVVLVVDDEEIVRRTVGRMLASLGFEPVLLAGGEEALAWLAAHPEGPAAVVLDLAMPAMDGRTCFREMRARRPGLNVIVSSGFTQNGRAQELIDQGAIAFVQKPYRADELARALAGATRAA